jgi:hypothetical protein
MTYQVSRNGQLYGPYTLEDLRRYVAAGNVLPGDMAKSEDMPEWATVAEVLGMPVAAPPVYAAPAAGYAAAPAGYGAPVAGAVFQDPPNLNWGLELLLGFLTCGLFVVVWNLVIASWAKRVEPASKALLFYIIATVLILMNFGSSWGAVIEISRHQPYHQNVIGSLITIVCWVIRLIARFSLRDTLEQHFNGPEPLGVRFNPVLVFFFGGIYMQYKLNEVNQIKQNLRYQSLPR